MRPELERMQLIEQHVLGPLTPEAGTRWQTLLLLDEALAKDAAAQQQLYHGIRVAGRQQLRRELQQIHEQLYRPRRSWVQTAVAGLRRALPWPARPSRR